MKATRIILASFGAVFVVLGAVIMQQTVSTQHILGLLLWLACALIIHDGIVAPAVFVATIVMRKAGRSVPPAVLSIIQGAIVVGSVFSAIVLPAIYAKRLAPNDTILPFDYAGRLGLLWAAVVVAAALAIFAYYLAARRQKERAPASQA
jgi:hypothetical protein